MKKYLVFFILSITVFCLVFALSMSIEKNKINKDSLFSLLVENYCSGTISYEECDIFYTRYFSDGEMNDSLLQIYNTLTEVKQSKENFSSAFSHYAQSNFIKSYNLFVQVIEEDIENYDEALKNMRCIVQYVESEIESLTRSGDYDAALGMFEEMSQHMDLSLDLCYRLEKCLMSMKEEE